LEAEPEDANHIRFSRLLRIIQDFHVVLTPED
jgi:Ca2+-binding EF-hand superfamily protein